MKKQFKKMTALLMAAVMGLSLAACSPKAAQDQTQSQPQTTQAQPAETQTTQAQTEGQPTSAAEENKAAFPVTLTDHAGRTVTIESQPEKIVSGYYITTSLLIALGLKDKTVGIEAKAKSRPIYALSAPEFLDLPDVGSAKEFNLEACAALEPDLVIVPMKLKDSAQAMEELGLKVLLVNPEDEALLEETIDMVGQATGTREAAKKLIDYTQDTLKKLQDTLKDAGQPKVYLGGNSSFLSTAGASMYQNTLIVNGGGANAAAELEDTYWAEVSYEQILAWNPEVIVVVPGAQYTVEDVLKDPQLAEVTAVKEKAVYQMPASFEAWDSPVPSAVLGSLWMAAILHGDVYSFDTFKTDAADFYKTFYGIDIDTSLLTK